VIEMKSLSTICDTPRRSTPKRGARLNVLSIPLGIPKAGIPKGIVTPVFSLSHRHSPTGSASQPPPPNKLSTGGWEVKEWRWDREKTKAKKIQKTTNKSQKQKIKKRDRNTGEKEVGALEVVQLTRRDEAMLDWLSVVRMADQEAVRWALAALPTGHADEPVGVRRGNQWIARLVKEGLVQRAQPAFNDRSIIWATHQGIGKVAPNLYRQTTRHEVAVAAVAARYLARGYRWYRDRKPAGLLDHQADGVAVKGNIVELVEVELTAKTLHRYKLICNSHAARMTNGSISRVVYLGTPDAVRAVAGEADKFIFRTERDRLLTLPTFDVRGRWVGSESQLWDTMPEPVENADGIPTPELWDRQAIV